MNTYFLMLKRNKWLELTREGMSSEEANINADKYAEECMKEYTEIQRNKYQE